MSTDLTQPLTLVNPATGEVLTLDSPTEDLGGFLAAIREQEQLAREAKRLVTNEVLKRCDEAAQWVVRAGGYVLKGTSPAPSEEFDELALREDLLRLVDDGVLTIEAVDRAVETVVTYKVRRSGLNALRKLGGRVAEVIASHARPVEKTRYVTVERA